MKKTILILFLVLSALNIRAGCYILCNAKYLYQVTENNQGSYSGSTIGDNPVYGGGSSTRNIWSNTYTLNVGFYSGYELNESAGQILFENRSLIAIVKWDNGGRSVIKLDKWGTKLKYVDEKEMLYNTSTGEKITEYHGYDTEGRYWEFYL